MPNEHDTADTPETGRIGLALSGGGFRATAFHLGVLKRLRELGLLERISVISTVSGGSIAGAAWALWQAMGKVELSDDEVWDRFQYSLLRTMSIGLRPVIFLVGFLLPALLTVAAGLIALWRFGQFTPAHTGVLTRFVFLLSYLCWHYLSPYLLDAGYERTLFGRNKLGDLNPETANRRVPLLMVNATGLNGGQHMVFATAQVDMSYAGLFPAMVLKTQPRHALRRGVPSIPMPLETKLSKAVAASSALPGVFAPLHFRGVLNRVVGFLRTPIWGKGAVEGNFDVVDGGVFDNQGTYLIGDLCRHLIVSDGSAALRLDPRPSTWQLWPPGKGVIFRAQDIIYERVRELGYQRLEDRQRFYEALKSCGLDNERVQKLAREQGALESYSYVELLPNTTFAWQYGKQRLPEKLLPLVATIRTDLDRFSPEEIAALMFHGYTSIDHCLHTYQANLLPKTVPPLNFTLPGTVLFADWSKPSDSEIERAAAHLSASGSRVKSWRGIRRLIAKNLRDKSQSFR